MFRNPNVSESERFGIFESELSNASDVSERLQMPLIDVALDSPQSIWMIDN